MRYRRLNVRVPSKNVTIAAGYDEVLRATGYRRNLLKTALFHIIAVVSLGIPYFIVYWFEFLIVPLQYSICEVKKAEVLLLKDVHGQKYVSKVQFQEAKPGFPVEFCLNSSSHTEPTTPTDNTCLRTKKQIKFFIHKKWKYIWRPEIEAFRLLSGIDTDTTLIDFHDKFQGYSSEVQSSKLLLYGPNTVNVSIKSYLRLLLEEVLNPFYVFEAFSIAVWTVDKYIYYAYVIIIVTVISIVAELYETRKQSIALREMVSSQCSRVQIVRPHGIEEEDASCLVPGDVITIPVEGILMPCDAVVISGNCIVDESMLTGESSPETKTPLPYVDELYDPDVHKRHTLFCGTRVLQVRHYGANQVTAVVIRTGFNTARGELVRAILHPKPVGFHFYKDAMKFMGLMAIVAVFGMIYAIYIYIEKKAPLDEIIIRALDIITIVVPPAMPAAMTVGTVYSQTRLRKQGIFCISPPRINIAGKVKLVCFDKTGTLTENGLDFWGVVPRRGLVLGPLIQETALLAPKDPLLVALATCHTLSCVNGQLTGSPLDVKMFQATGWVLEEMACDPSRTDLMTPAVVKPSIDDCEYMSSIEMSQTNFLIPYEVGILRQFPFSSKLQRMSVIVRTLGSSHMELYCKGSPEKLRTLCDPATVPATMEKSLLSYTCKGFRVLALAHRKLESKLSWHNMHRLKREQAERDMNFLGFLVMHNCLKPETVSVIKKLDRANIRTVMLTGDNLLTAASVGRECGMISLDHKLIQVTALPPLGDNPASIHYTYMPGTFHVHGSQSQSFNESNNPVISSTELENNKQLVINMEPPLRGPYSLVMSGRTWSIVRVHFPEMTQRLLLKGTIFARLSPDQKTQIVEELQEMGYTVAMVGDGCNDCGALKAADVGVSLSEAEASVAAPFTSKGGNISCVPLLIQEGRCALVTSFGVFKYMALYSLIQFISVLILYSRHTTLGDMMFLYHDLLITTSVAVLMTKTGPYPELVARRPRGSLLSTANLFSVGLQIMITFTLQLAALLLVMTQPWFRPIQPIDDELIIQCWETTSIFIISSFQYLILSVAFSYGPPFRQPFYTNVPFILTLLALAGFTLVLGIYPFKSLASFFEVVGMDDYENMFHVWIARVGLIFLVGLNGALALLVEYLCGDSQWFRQLLDKAQGKTKSKHAYKELEKSLQKEDWPPISTYDQSLVEHT